MLVLADSNLLNITKLDSPNLDIRRGLVLYLPIVNTSGEAIDYSGVGNNGTFGGSSSRVLGKVGLCLECDGVDGEIDCGNNSSLYSNTGSIILLVKVNSAYRQMFCGWSTQLGEGPYELSTGSDSKLYFNLANAVSNRIVTSTGVDFSVYVGKWAFIVCTWNGSEIKVYINSVHIETKVYSGVLDSSSSYNLKLGYRDANWKLNGLLDEFKQYNVELNINEIEQLYRIVK